MPLAHAPLLACIVAVPTHGCKHFLTPQPLGYDLSVKLRKRFWIPQALTIIPRLCALFFFAHLLAISSLFSVPLLLLPSFVFSFETIAITQTHLSPWRRQSKLVQG